MFRRSPRFELPMSINRLVKTELRIVEPMQMEASFQYRLMLKHPGQAVVYPDRYQIESYFIFPPQMRISPATYPIDSFYRDLKSFINFRIPKLSYKEIVGSVENFERSPLRKILDELESESAWAEKSRFVEQESRIFACSFYTFIQRKNKRLQKQVDRIKKINLSTPEVLQASQGRLLASFEEIFRKVYDIFYEWRKILRTDAANHAEVQDTLKAIDEYIVQNLLDFTLNVDRLLYDIRLGESAEVPWKKMLRIGLRGLRIYAKRQSYQWVDEVSSELELERYFYHRGTLKRQVWSALYLDTRTKPLFKIQRQVGAMIAAGAAGAWAVFADITIRMRSGMGTQGFDSLGFSTFLIITAFTMAYILKDRIKELGRGYFKGGLFGNLPDNSSKIIYQANSRRKSLDIGTHEEKVSYFDPQALPEDLSAILKEVAHERWDQEPHAIICYRKRVDLRGKKVRSLKHKIRAIYTFFRLNVSHFLSPLDLPYEELLVSTRNLETSSRVFPKVYHIDLVIKITARVAQQEKSQFQYWRLVINKGGIKRIDEVKLAQELEGKSEEDIEEEPLSNIEAFDEMHAANA